MHVGTVCLSYRAPAGRCCVRLCVVVLLSAVNEKRELYAHFLREREIEYVDCVDPLLGTPGRMVNREGHPNGAMNSSWAKCLEARLRLLLRELDAEAAAPRSGLPSAPWPPSVRSASTSSTRS